MQYMNGGSPSDAKAHLTALKKRMDDQEMLTDQASTHFENAEESLSELEKNKSSEAIRKACGDVTTIVKSTMDSINKLKSDDALEVAMGVMNIAEAAMPLIGVAAGPVGPVIGMTVSIVGCVLGWCAKSNSSSPESILMQKIAALEKAMKAETDKQMMSRARANLDKLQDQRNLLVTASNWLDDLSEREKDDLTDKNWIYSGDVLIREVWDALSGDLGTQDSDQADRTASLVILYSQLGCVRHSSIFLFSTIMYAIGNKVYGLEALNHMKKQKGYLQQNLSNVIDGLPDEHNHNVYGRINLADDQEVKQLHEFHQALGGAGFAGKLVRIQVVTDTYFGLWLATGYMRTQSKGDVGRHSKTMSDQPELVYFPLFFSLGSDTVFRIFYDSNGRGGDTPTEEYSDCRIFCCIDGGYVITGSAQQDDSSYPPRVWQYDGNYVDFGKWDTWRLRPRHGGARTWDPTGPFSAQNRFHDNSCLIHGWPGQYGSALWCRMEPLNTFKDTVYQPGTHLSAVAKFLHVFRRVFLPLFN